MSYVPSHLKDLLLVIDTEHSALIPQTDPGRAYVQRLGLPRRFLTKLVITQVPDLADDLANVGVTIEVQDERG